MKGVSKRLLGTIKNDSIYEHLPSKSNNNIGVLLEYGRLDKDNFNSSYEIEWSNENITAFDVYILFPKSKDTKKHKLRCKSFYNVEKLFQDLNLHIDKVEKGGDYKSHYQFVFCWGDNTYKVNGIHRYQNAYIYIANNIKVCNINGMKTTLLSNIPILVVTDGHYNPVFIAPFHDPSQGERVCNLIKPEKVTKHFFPSKSALNFFTLDEERKEHKPSPIKRTAVEVKSSIKNRAAPESMSALQEENENFLSPYIENDNSPKEPTIKFPVETSNMVWLQNSVQVEFEKGVPTSNKSASFRKQKNK